MERYELKLYKVYVNDDPELTMSYNTAISNLPKLVAALKSDPYIAHSAVYILLLVLRDQ